MMKKMLRYPVGQISAGNAAYKGLRFTETPTPAEAPALHWMM